VPSSSKRQQPGLIPMQSKNMKTLGAGEMSTTSGIIKVPCNLETSGKTDYLKVKIMYEKF
jgi:hypothetical protein